MNWNVARLRRWVESYGARVVSLRASMGHPALRRTRRHGRPPRSTLVTPQRQSIGTLNPWRILDSGERFLRLVCAFQSCLISSHSLSEVRAVIQSFYSMKGWADGLTSGEHSLVGRGGPLCLVLTRARAPGSQRVLDPATQT